MLLVGNGLYMTHGSRWYLGYGVVARGDPPTHSGNTRRQIRPAIGVSHDAEAGIGPSEDRLVQIYPRSMCFINFSYIEGSRDT